MVNSFLVSCCFVLATAVSIDDWLITPQTSFPEVTFTKGEINGLSSYTLSNGLISRQFIVSPNFGTVAYDSYVTGNAKSAILRALSPEAIVGINNTNYNIGGFNFITTTQTNTASPNTAYIDPSWITKSNLITNATTTFMYNNVSITPMWIPYEWTPGTRHAPLYLSWPPLGLAIEIEFIAPPTITSLPAYVRDNLRIYVRYEMYQGMPIISKSLLIKSLNPQLTSNVIITTLMVETLKVNVPYSPGAEAGAINSCAGYAEDSTLYPMIAYSGGLYLETDQAHGPGIRWSDDVNMPNIWGSYQPNVDVGYYPSNQQKYWAVRLNPALPGTMNGTLRSFRALEIAMDLNELGNMERSGLARRRMLAHLSPTTKENPIFAATVDSTHNESLTDFIDQCNETGFELLIFSFGSGFNMETNDQKTIDFYANVIEYGAKKGVEIGGYDLIMLDRTYDKGEYQIIDDNGKTVGDLCFASDWYDLIVQYFNNFIDVGMMNIITDGPYGGQSCYARNHSFHENANDSIFRQEHLQNEFFVNIKNKGVYIHQPDNYFYYGGSKTGMGYNENQYSLPRWLDLTVSRMGMYDDTFVHLNTQGWMFLPLTAYHSSNPDCYFEPLSKNIDQYDWALGQYFGFGVMAMMRGKEVYDTNDTKAVVVKWTSFYNKHRQILISDIIHLRRCDMQGFDAILHANALLLDGANEKGLAMFYNPMNQTIKEDFTFSLYYTGISNNAQVSFMDEPFTEYQLNHTYYITLSLSMPPVSIQYFVFK